MSNLNTYQLISGGENVRVSLKIRKLQIVSTDTTSYSNLTVPCQEDVIIRPEADRPNGFQDDSVEELQERIFIIAFSLSLSLFFEIPVARSFVMLKYINASVTY